MRSFRRSVQVPAAVLDRTAGVRSGRDRVLAAAEARDGTWLLGTRDALLVVRTESAPGDGLIRVPWQRVETAEWDQDTEKLIVVEVGEFGQVRPSYSFEIGDPGLLAELVRERVTASVVLQRRVVVSGKRGLYVVARRAPHGDGEVTWAYEFDPGVDPEDPEVMRLAQAGLEAATRELGL